MAYREKESKATLTLSRVGIIPSEQEVDTVLKTLHEMSWPHGKFSVDDPVIIHGDAKEHWVVRVHWYWLEQEEMGF